MVLRARASDFVLTEKVTNPSPVEPLLGGRKPTLGLSGDKPLHGNKGGLGIAVVAREMLGTLAQ